MPHIVKCPTCHAPVAWQPENAYRPFCSETCQLIDLGAWANEERVMVCDEVLLNDDETMFS